MRRIHGGALNIVGGSRDLLQAASRPVALRACVPSQFSRMRGAKRPRATFSYSRDTAQSN